MGKRRNDETSFWEILICVIIIIIIAIPCLNYLMWKNGWFNKKARQIISGVSVVFVLVVILGGQTNEINSGVEVAEESTSNIAQNNLNYNSNEATTQETTSNVVQNDLSYSSSETITQEITTKEVTTKEATTQETTTEEATTKEVTTSESSDDNVNASLANNTLINPSACSVSGSRQANVKADIGYGDREYYGYTNSSSQLVYVTAASLEIQDDNSEVVKSSGRYCSDEAKVSGTEQSDLDEGHAIADSLGGVSNAYNITPQESTLNRHGEQYQMEEDVRTALENGHSITDFEYTITYPNTSTQIPSHYDVKYYDNGNIVTHSYDNEYSESSSPIQNYSSYSASEVTTTMTTLEPTTIEPTTIEVTTATSGGSVYYQNCTEVKAAGAAPITPGDPGWQDKFDRDGDGVACEY